MQLLVVMAVKLEGVENIGANKIAAAYFANRILCK
jgi:hypothetical protein